MPRLFFFLAISVLLVESLTGASLESRILRDRSPAIVVTPYEAQTEDVASYLVYGPFEVSGRANAMKISEFADAISENLLGNPFLRSKISSGAPRSTGRSSANLLFVLDSQQHDFIDSLQAKLTGATRSSLTSKSHPEDVISATTTLFSGQLPAAHGVLSRSWYTASGSLATAYSDRSSARMTSNLADLLWSSSPHSMVLSASSDAALASALGVSRSSQIPGGPRTLITKDGSIHSLSGPASQSWLSAPLQPETELFGSAGWLSAALKSEGVSVEVQEGSKLVVSFAGQQAVLDMTNEAVRSFLHELTLLSRVATALSRDATHPDALRAARVEKASDVLSFGFASFKPLESEHEAGTPELEAAARLLNAAILKLVATAETAYRGRISVQVVQFDQIHRKSAFVSQDVREQIVHQIKAAVHAKAPESVVEAVWPSFYIRPRPVQLQAVCANLIPSLAAVRATVNCDGATAAHPNMEAPHRLGRVLLQTNSNTSSNSTKFYTYSQINRYEIATWTSVLLIIVSIVAALVLCSMPYTKDTLLFFQPRGKTD